MIKDKEMLETLKTDNTSLSLELATQSTVYKAPVFKSVRNREWIPYVDIDGTQYPDKLIYYKNNSSLHGAILRSSADQVAGNGFKVTEDELQQATIDFLNDLGDNGEDANEILAKVADDLVTFKGFALLIKWSTKGDKIEKISHLDFSKIRANKVNEKGIITHYFYSYNWNTQRPNYVVLPSFNENTMKEQKKAYEEAIEKSTKSGKIVPELKALISSKTEQILYFHPYASNEFYYPLPYYVAAINPINTDIITDQYGLGMMDNGLNANHVVNFMGNYTDTQKKKEAKAFVKSYVNGVKKGRPVILFSKDEQHSVDIKPIGTNGKDEKYNNINSNVTQKILSGHGVTSPMLCGIREAGSLGGSNEIEIASNLYYRNSIRPKQNAITKVFNNLLKINNLGTVTIDRVNILPKNTEIEK